jgi:hypothetical protein
MSCLGFPFLEFGCDVNEPCTVRNAEQPSAGTATGISHQVAIHRRKVSWLWRIRAKTRGFVFVFGGWSWLGLGTWNTRWFCMSRESVRKEEQDVVNGKVRHSRRCKVNELGSRTIISRDW